MKKKLVGLTKEQIIETTIMLIDKKGGATAVNLREVARISGCSAPNIYNYFESLDDLFNTVLIRICDDYNKTLQIKIAKTPEELLLGAFRAYIEYAIEYPGRLNFFQFEKLNISVSEETEEMAEGVGYNMAHMMAYGTGKNITEEKMIEICNILHRYLLGELSEYITGKKKIEDKEAYVNKLVLYCKKLYDIFVQNI